jgi:hypothetical protein
MLSGSLYERRNADPRGPILLHSRRRKPISKLEEELSSPPWKIHIPARGMPKSHVRLGIHPPPLGRAVNMEAIRGELAG